MDSFFLNQNRFLGKKARAPRRLSRILFAQWGCTPSWQLNEAILVSAISSVGYVSPVRYFSVRMREYHYAGS
ncbi:hypothetical protein BCY86_00835 [Pajaroellobacter abortibovis]|uniref:Uncharacterized protein n=1 Tax=Pajaroellobacter abortibovis TaxID=1882918 RepID=A0A1L6MV42_9BACT|nr:hypothetical protein BCY86_00835 [Pajaroellobacter abortibovis]